MGISSVRTDFSPRGNDVLDVLEGEYALISLLPNTEITLPTSGALRVLIEDPFETTLILEMGAWQKIKPTGITERFDYPKIFPLKQLV
jgi:hypothetical protein